MRVIVIGAGFAGLSAGQRLAAEGHDVVVLEARDRVGGRVFTRRDETGDHPVELGAEWLDAHSSIPDLVRARGGTVHEASGRTLAKLKGETTQWDEEPDERLMRRLTSRLTDDRPVADALRECCAGEEWATARWSLLRYIEGFHAADPKALSTKWLQQVEETQSADASRLRTDDGLDLAAHALRPEDSTRYQLQLSSVVREVRWGRGQVVVSVDAADGTSSREIVADAAIITLPLSLLQLADDHPSAVRFDPPLDAKRPALQQLSMGDVVKVVLHFDTPFWEEEASTRDMLFLFDWTQTIPTWWSSKPKESGRLTGWSGGPQVRKLDASRGQSLVEPAIESLAAIVGRSPAHLARTLRVAHVHDWRDDPFALGAYSWVRAGGVDAHRLLAEPLEQTLFFAGEATCGGGYNATVRGAVESGRRAADELQRCADSRA